MTTPTSWPFVNIITDGKTKGHWAYFRSKETGNIRLKGLPGEPGFGTSYDQALELRNRLRAGPVSDKDPDSWTWLIDRYLKSVEFAALADATQLDYARTCALLARPGNAGGIGDTPFRFTTRGMLKTLRDDFAATVRKANKVQQMTSCIYSWAQQEQLVPDGFNPAMGLKRLKRKGGEREIVPWSDQEVAWVLAAAPAHVVTPILLALYTGQRREDVASMTWQQCQGDWVRVRTSKTRALLDMPCHPILRDHLDKVRVASKVVSLAGPICLTEAGRPFSVNGLSGAVRRVVQRHPQVPNNRSMHGLRYAAAARMEEGGATVAMLQEVLGHRTFKMALKYASGRLRAAQGIAAMGDG